MEKIRLKKNVSVGNIALKKGQEVLVSEISEEAARLLVKTGRAEVVEKEPKPASE
jgi:hypothetical protein